LAHEARDLLSPLFLVIKLICILEHLILSALVEPKESGIGLFNIFEGIFILRGCLNTQIAHLLVLMLKEAINNWQQVT